MSDPFVGEIKMWSFAWAPRGWLLCNGAVLPMQQYAALFALLGTTFGGDGRTTFGLPDLRGRTPIGTGVNPGDPTVYRDGTTAGSETVALAGANLPAHTHLVNAYDVPGTLTFPKTTVASGSFARAVPASSSTVAFNVYLPGATGSAAALANTTVSNAGADAPHDNMQPFTVLNFCIAAMGIFPPRP